MVCWMARACLGEAAIRRHATLQHGRDDTHRVADRLVGLARENLGIGDQIAMNGGQ